jgi:hypothetical protein
MSRIKSFFRRTRKIAEVIVYETVLNSGLDIFLFAILFPAILLAFF